MTKKIVYWKHKYTGQTGHGMPIEEDLAGAWVEYGNNEFPNINHWAADLDISKEQLS